MRKATFDDGQAWLFCQTRPFVSLLIDRLS